MERDHVSVQPLGHPGPRGDDQKPAAGGDVQQGVALIVLRQGKLGGVLQGHLPHHGKGAPVGAGGLRLSRFFPVASRKEPQH